MLVSGCNIAPNKSTTTPDDNMLNNNEFEQIMQQLQGSEESADTQPTNTQQFLPNAHNKTLTNYVEQMALQLTDTMQVAPQDAAIAIASFVDLDSTLKTANQLGNQLSETFIHQLQKFGYTAVDFKTANLITVSSKGDFAFSREARHLTHDNIATHILSGTLIYRKQGIEVNARIIDVTSKRLAASSRSLIPFYVLNKEDIYLSSN